VFISTTPKQTKHSETNRLGCLPNDETFVLIDKERLRTLKVSRDLFLSSAGAVLGHVPLHFRQEREPAGQVPWSQKLRMAMGEILIKMPGGHSKAAASGERYQEVPAEPAVRRRNAHFF
jgi:hypothetical protein